MNGRGSKLAPMASRMLGCRLNESGEIAFAGAIDAALDAGLIIDLAWAKSQIEGQPGWIESGRPTLPGFAAVKTPPAKSHRKRRRVAG